MSDDEAPLLQELLGDLHVGGTGLPDEACSMNTRSCLNPNTSSY